MTRILNKEERVRERAFIADQDGWPRWPLLPMKNLAEPGHPRGAFLTWEQATLAMGGRVFHLREMMLKLSGPALGDPTEEFRSLDELFNAGWMID